MIAKELKFCPECGGSIISLFCTGDILCHQCGLVIIERNIDFIHHCKRTYNFQQKIERDQVGPSLSLFMPYISLSTFINKNEIKNLHPDAGSTLERAIIWNSRLKWKDRHLLYAISEVKRISSNLNLPDYVKKEAILLYKHIQEKEILQGRSINAMIAACLSFSCKFHQIPRTTEEIRRDSRFCSQKLVRRSFRLIIAKLGLESPPPIDTIKYLHRYINEFNLPSKIKKTSIDFFKRFYHSYNGGFTPGGICGAAIYLSCKLNNIKFTQEKIAKTLKIAKGTLRARIKDFKDCIRTPFLKNTINEVEISPI